MRSILMGLGLVVFSSIWHPASAATPSLSGTTIPSATQIVDIYNNVWTLSGGQVYENGRLTPSGGVILVLCYGGYVYQENAQHNWWVRDIDHTPQNWVASSDPRVTSASGAILPNATQIIDSDHNIWTVSKGQAFENGKPTPSSSITHLFYSRDTVYQENVHNNWYEWRNGAWVATPPVTLPSASGTSIPTVTEIVDNNLNVWTVASGVVYENHVATQSSSVTLLLYYGGSVYQENIHNAWYQWNGKWVATADPRVGAPLAYVASCTPGPCQPEDTNFSVTAIDTGTNRVTGTIPLTFQATSLVVTLDAKQVYAGGTTNSAPLQGFVAVINAAQNKVVKTIPLSALPGGFAASPDGTKMYVFGSTNPQVGTTIFTIDTASSTVIASRNYPLFVLGASHVAVSADGTKLYVPGYMATSSPTPGAIYIIDAATLGIESQIDNSAYTRFDSTFLSNDHTKLYCDAYYTPAANWVMAVLNPVTGAVDAHVPAVLTSGLTAALSPDGQHLYGLGLGGIGALSTATNLPTAGVVGVPAVTSGAVGLAVTPDGKQLYITDYYGGRVIVADAATYTISTILPLAVSDEFAIAIVQPH